MLFYFSGLDTVRAPRPFSAASTTSSKASIAYSTTSRRNIAVPVTEEGVVGRQLVNEILLPSISQVSFKVVV